MEKGPIFERASNPKQYDLPDLEWSEQLGLESPSRAFFWEQLQPYSAEWKDGAILDVGAGSGWLLHEVNRFGPAEVLGIEPSEKNRGLGKKHFPDVPLEDATLENFKTTKKFNTIFSVMSAPHMPNMDIAFQRIASLLEENGKAYMITPDYDYYKLPRHGYEVSIEERSPEEFVAAVKRPFGVLADIVRRDEVYLKAAEQAGLSLAEKKALPPSETLLERVPKYKAFEGRPIVQLFVFQKHHDTK